MNQLVLSGTMTLVPSGTGSSCYRGPESVLSACNRARSSCRNFTNQKSFGFLLTDRAVYQAVHNRRANCFRGRCATVPHVEPGGASLLRLSEAKRVLLLIDAVEPLDIDPADAAPDYWHQVHNRLFVNETPRACARSRHHAWLHRHRVAP